MTRHGEFTLRRAALADAPVVHRLLRDLAASLGKAEAITSTAEDIARFGFGDHPRFEALLAFDGDEPVGLAVFFFEFSTWRARGRGLGRELMDAVRQRSATLGGCYVKLSVYDGNPAAIGFYRGIGFEICDDEQVLALRD
jgi:GNAT superfamily N-acetyltransferase